MYRFQVITCAVCGARATEWCYQIEQECPPALCQQHGGPEPYVITSYLDQTRRLPQSQWPRDRKGTPLPKHMLYAKMYKYGRDRVLQLPES